MANILIADRLLAGRPHADWKEGWEFYHAFRALGHKADICGPDCPVDERTVPQIASNYDLVLITENYPSAEWKFWDWSVVKTAKLFWAIDTHLVDYTGWVAQAGIDYVACNNKADVFKFGEKGFWLPYGVSKLHYGVDLAPNKLHDVVFIGGMTPMRQYYVNKYKMKHISTYGPDYVRSMQEAKICFNHSISYDINAKYLEIIGSGSFMLTNSNDALKAFINSEYIDKMFYSSEGELASKIAYYLAHDDEREDIAKKAREVIFAGHSYEKRAQFILDTVL